MTGPNPEQKQDTQKPATPRRGSVVSYKHDDRITGRELEGLAVVLGIEEGPDGDKGTNLVLRPLSDGLLYVDPANVTAVSTGDVTPG